MNRLPDPNARQPHPTTAGQPTPNNDTLHRAAQIAAAVDAVYQQPTRYRDDTLPSTPTIGTTPPVTQPGRPAMSSKATDDSVRMLTAGWLTLCAGGATSAVLHFSSTADPTVVALVAAVPASLAIPVLALSRLVKHVKDTVEAAPTEHHHHYTGTVIQDARTDARTINAHNRGLWATTHNQLQHRTDR